MREIDYRIIYFKCHKSCIIIRTLAAFQLRSLGILPFCANNTITAAVTLVTTPGGDPNDFNSVKFDLFNVFNASCK